MDQERYTERVKGLLENNGYGGINHSSGSLLVADYKCNNEHGDILKFVVYCLYVNDSRSFNIPGKKLEVTNDVATALKRIPIMILGHTINKYYILIPEQSYYSLFGNYPLVSVEDYHTINKANPKLIWKKARIMIEDKRKRTVSWIGKLRGIRVMSKGPYLMFRFKDFMKHVNELSSDNDITLPHYWKKRC